MLPYSCWSYPQCGAVLTQPQPLSHQRAALAFQTFIPTYPYVVYVSPLGREEKANILVRNVRIDFRRIMVGTMRDGTLRDSRSAIDDVNPG